MEYSIVFDCDSGRSPTRSRRVHLQLLAGVHYNPVRELAVYRPEGDINPVKSFWKPEEKPAKPVPEPTEDVTKGSSADMEKLEVADVQCTSACTLCACGTPITIGGQEFCVLPDSGSQLSVISRPAWESLSGERKNYGCIIPIPGMNIRGLGGKLVPIVGVARITLKISDDEDFKTNKTIHNAPFPLKLILGFFIRHSNRSIF